MTHVGQIFIQQENKRTSQKVTDIYYVAYKLNHVSFIFIHFYSCVNFIMTSTSISND